MICYLIRHGQDDETVRGGWSEQPLTEEGVLQAEALAAKIADLPIKQVYTSDLTRALQTAQIIAQNLELSVTPLPQFREVNNGKLAGMKNDQALVHYPGLFWNQLGWEQNYPDGESPKAFFDRISNAWKVFSQRIISQNEDVILVTHAGVIHVILTIAENRQYSNKDKQPNVKHAEVIALTYANSTWKV